MKPSFDWNGADCTDLRGVSLLEGKVFSVKLNPHVKDLKGLVNLLGKTVEPVCPSVFGELVRIISAYASILFPLDSRTFANKLNSHLYGL